MIMHKIELLAPLVISPRNWCYMLLNYRVSRQIYVRNLDFCGVSQVDYLFSKSSVNRHVCSQRNPHHCHLRQLHISYARRRYSCHSSLNICWQFTHVSRKWSSINVNSLQSYSMDLSIIVRALRLQTDIGLIIVVKCREIAL